MDNKLFKISLLSTSILLASCGGGSDGETNQTNKVVNSVPTVSFANITVNEKDVVELTASANSSTENIVSYQWAITSGQNIALSNANDTTLSFTAPETLEDDVIELSLTVTDTSGDTATANGQVNVKQILLPTLSLSGTVPANTFQENAQIKVNLDDQYINVSTITDEMGQYNIDLQLDDSYANAFISIESHSTDESNVLVLTSMLGSYEYLMQQAGDNTTLTAEENIGVNINIISTAQYAVALQENNYQTITIDETWQQLSSSINYNDVLSTATTLHLFTPAYTDWELMTLPEGIADTLSLFKNKEAYIDYVRGINNYSLIDTYKQNTVNIHNIAAVQDNFSVPNNYFPLSNSSITHEAYTFNLDGTGMVGTSAMQWSEKDGVISIVFNERIFLGYVQVEVSFNQFEFAELYETRQEIRQLSTSENGDVLAITTHQVRVFDTVEEYPQEVREPFHVNSVLAVNNNQSETLPDFTLAKAYVISLDFIDQAEQESSIEIYADELTLEADGSGHSTALDEPIQWNIDNNELQITYPNTNEQFQTATYKKIAEGSVFDQFSYQYTVEEDRSVSDKKYKVKSDLVGLSRITTEQVNWKQNQVPGIYLGSEATAYYDSHYFWFELHENGDAETINVSFNENYQKLVHRIEYGSWQINQDGTLTLIRAKKDDGAFGVYSEDCRTGNENGCFVYHERTVRIVNQSDNNIGVFHKSYFPTDSNFGTSYDNRIWKKISERPVDITNLTISTKENIATQQENRH